MKIYSKKVLAGIVCVGLLICLSACGKGSKWIFSLNGEKVYDKDITVFGLIYAMEHKIDNTDKLKELYDEKQTYQEYYKGQLEDEIISTVLLYGKAKEDNCNLTEEAKEEILKKVDELTASYGEDWMEKKKIKSSDIEKIYEMKLLGDSYIKKQKEEKNGNDPENKGRYIKVYQVTFPTVLLDENGMVKSNQDGTIQKQSEEMSAKRKSDAEEFARKVKSGEAMEKLVKDYDNTVTGVEKILKYEDLDTAYRKEIDKISVGQSSDVIVSEYGYYVVKLLDTNDTEYADLLSDYENEKSSQDERAEVLQELYDAWIRDDKHYKNSKRWDKIKFASFLK